MFAPAGQTTARAGQLCWLAALVVRRQAVLTPPRGLRCRILPPADMESAPTVQGIALYRFASFPATSPDRALMTSTSTSRTTAVP